MLQSLYSVYIPKYPDSKCKSATHGKEGPWPLPFEIGKYLSRQTAVDTIIVSPGYMSYGIWSCMDFLSALEIEIFRRDQSYGTRQPNSIEIGLLKGVNGFRMVKGEDKRTFPPEIATASNEISALKLHELDSAVLSDGLTVRAMVPTNFVNKEGTKDEISNDHRKQIFFINSFIDDAFHPLSDFIDDEGKSDSEKMEEWLDIIKVKAMCIGSSNFSFKTYFGKFDKSEADLLMMIDDDAGNQYAHGLQQRIEDMDGQNGEAPNGIALSKSMAIAAPSPEQFLKKQLDDLLKHSLVF